MLIRSLPDGNKKYAFVLTKEAHDRDANDCAEALRGLADVGRIAVRSHEMLPRSCNVVGFWTKQKGEEV